MTQLLKFDSPLPREVPVEIGDKQYRLVEPSAKEMHRYRSELSGLIVMGEDGKPRTTDVAKMTATAPVLVGICLRDSDGKPVPQSTVSDWPDGLVGKLYEACLSLFNDATKKDETDEDREAREAAERAERKNS